MNQLKIIHDYGWPSQTLHKQEQEMKNAHLCQCALAVRLVMVRELLWKDSVSFLRIHRNGIRSNACGNGEDTVQALAQFVNNIHECPGEVWGGAAGSEFF
ncbi:hypothetical protein B1691_15670 [Geobacillus sp. 47C-IIb]|uniref:hypothetical protein n=1 Tax=Geobacillus TaxID=129337 RepID=UPI0009BCD224|nr:MULTISPECIES: hypothetical protein [Geobacillus]ATO37692.1 hypothetical protein GTID1_11115 [Geobacillus thermodenitrificans]OQP08381.1 hypothetical protein B1691_15670 [Geobacillus sp. 47C-IIb]QNU32730.1 hypothetical protein IC804_08730 [Geobacillus sp. 47C-IIb]